MEVKIKQGSEMLDATIEMVDGVMVVSPKEKFEPKDGDVVFSGSSLISIFKEMSSGTSFASYAALSNGEFKKEFDFWSASNIRPATEKEKQKLFDNLAEEGWEFDFEKKELIKLRWKPKVDETCFLPCFDFPKFIAKQWLWEINGFSTYHYNEGWVFRTKEECQEFCNRLNDAINSIKP